MRICSVGDPACHRGRPFVLHQLVVAAGASQHAGIPSDAYDAHRFLQSLFSYLPVYDAARIHRPLIARYLQLLLQISRAVSRNAWMRRRVSHRTRRPGGAHGFMAPEGASVWYGRETDRASFKFPWNARL